MDQQQQRPDKQLEETLRFLLDQHQQQHLEANSSFVGERFQQDDSPLITVKETSPCPIKSTPTSVTSPATNVNPSISTTTNERGIKHLQHYKQQEGSESAAAQNNERGSAINSQTRQESNQSAVAVAVAPSIQQPSSGLPMMALPPNFIQLIQHSLGQVLNLQPQQYCNSYTQQSTTTADGHITRPSFQQGQVPSAMDFQQFMQHHHHRGRIPPMQIPNAPPIIPQHQLHQALHIPRTALMQATQTPTSYLPPVPINPLQQAISTQQQVFLQHLIQQAQFILQQEEQQATIPNHQEPILSNKNPQDLALAALLPGWQQQTNGLWVPVTRQAQAITNNSVPAIVTFQQNNETLIKAPVTNTEPPQALLTEPIARARRKYNHESFLLKLYRMLGELERDGSDSIMSFTGDGKCIQLHDPERFQNEIMLTYFRHSRQASFKRQLSMYGFHRVSKGPNVGAFEHSHFQKGRLELVGTMKRVSELIVVDTTLARHER
jgi:hypothetical protein